MEGFGQPTFAEALCEYVLALRAAGRAERTVVDRKRLLLRFECCCDGALPITSSPITSFLSSLHVSSNTLAQYTAELRSFFNYCIERGWLMRSPLVGIPRIRRRPALIAPLHMEDIERALRVAKPRERAVVITLLTTGLRKAELAGLRDGDVDWERGVAAVRGKGGYLRHVAISRPDELRPWIGGLTPDTIRRDLERLARRSKVPLRSHLFRHTHAVQLLKAGVRVDHVQQLLGHASLDTTMIYLRYAEREQEALEAQRQLGVLTSVID